MAKKYQKGHVFYDYSGNKYEAISCGPKWVTCVKHEHHEMTAQKYSIDDLTNCNNRDGYHYTLLDSYEKYTNYVEYDYLKNIFNRMFTIYANSEYKSPTLTQLRAMKKAYDENKPE